MVIEASKALHVKFPEEELWLKPYEPMDLPQELALRLLAKAPDMVGLVTSINPKSVLKRGYWVEFESPLFGSCTGMIKTIQGDRVTVDDHSVIETAAQIRVCWIVRILLERP